MTLVRDIVSIFASFALVGAAVLVYAWMQERTRRREWDIVVRHARGFDDRVRPFGGKAEKK